MELLAGFMPLLTAGIFFMAFLALLLSGTKAMLNASIDPVKENQARMEKRIDTLELKLDQVLERISS